MIRSLALILVPSLLAAGPAVSRAQSSAHPLDAARRGLAQYDLEGEGTLDVIRDLSQVLAHPPSVRAAREAAFLRDMAAADLLLLDTSEAMRARVAGALGVPPEQVVDWIEADLGRAAVGPYRRPARQGLAALRLRGAERPDYGSTRGPRRDALYLSEVEQALMQTQPEGALAALGVDPCAEGARCDQAFSHFDAQGRQAVAAVVEARAALARMADAEAGGDPFARARAEARERLTQRLDALSLRPAPRLPDDGVLPTVGAGDERASFDVVMLIEARQLRLGRVATARVAEDGSVSLNESDLPLLPETRAFRLPAGFRPVVRAIPALSRNLPRLSEGTRVALGVAPDVPAHLMSRVFLSAREAGFEPSVLLGRSPHGLVATEFRGVVAGERTPPTDLRVHVRLGGYAVASRSGDSVQLPRVHGDDGLHFDVQGLRSLAEARHPRSASLRFMSVVDSGPVLSAAFGLAPRADELTVVMP